jgi:hypothetical protein
VVTVASTPSTSSATQRARRLALGSETRSSVASIPRSHGHERSSITASPSALRMAPWARSEVP